MTVATVTSYYSITLKFNELFRSRFESIVFFFFVLCYQVGLLVPLLIFKASVNCRRSNM